MSMLWINGAETALPVAKESDFGSLVRHVRGRMTGSEQIVSRISVNGVPLEDSDEADLAAVLIADLDTVEVRTQSPREIAVETLEALLEFSDQLAQVSSTCGEASDLRRLIDGISIFVESLSQARAALSKEACLEVDAQEEELASLLESLLSTMNQPGDLPQMELMSQRIPQHFAVWRDVAIPALLNRLEC